ncbi:S41 family peptidase [Pseudidiomarina insulisalsae]|nr:S41 family peptidase [Pseudidiomarina insulisalsae]
MSFNTLFASLLLLVSLNCSYAQQSTTTFTPAQLREDFSQLYQNLQSGSYDLFAHYPQVHYDRDYQNFLAALEQPLTKLEAQKLFMRFVALARIAHTRIDFPVADYRSFLENSGKTLPFDLRIHTEGVFIYEGEQAVYRMTLRDAQSQEIYTVTQPTLAQKDQLQSVTDASTAERKLRDYEVRADGIGYLKPGPFYNIYASSDAEVWDTTEFHSFIDEAFTALKQAEVTRVLIDLRGNPGGTNSFSDHMLAWIADQPFKFASDFRVKVSPLARQANQQRLQGNPTAGDTSLQLEDFYARHQEGDIISFPLADTPPHGATKSMAGTEVFILVDRYSFSNAVSVASIAQDYGFATVIGEKTADLATTYAAMEHFTLRHTGIEVGFPKAHIIRPNGDLKADGVTPDISFSFGTAKNGAKTELERVIDLIQQETLNH